MAIQKQEFVWRPNDNSGSTLLKYELEAQHWTKAFKSAQRSQAPLNYGEVFTTIGIIIGLALTLLTIVVQLLMMFFKWLFSQDNNTACKVAKKYNASSSMMSITERSIREIIMRRPSVFKPNRHKLFKKAALMVVAKQKVSISGMMYELKIDFDIASRLIDELFEAGIISGIDKEKQRKVFIDDKMSLDLLYHMEKQYSTI
ncbi:DNA translocase FtsK [Gelidibacter maritimus]|uniref:FtsK gamma domain-containing protein n=1 Tax=Gelidibacter maritimus TaxID=2761487 RepID=A0A7W2R252_9FLAO|nr:DNA translocase FtsK [Gelidibacter maritimus]MBA6151451.1 hypothetical protein [Gelidibacter maritimus]